MGLSATTKATVFARNIGRLPGRCRTGPRPREAWPVRLGLGIASHHLRRSAGRRGRRSGDGSGGREVFRSVVVPSEVADDAVGQDMHEEAVDDRRK